MFTFDTLIDSYVNQSKAVLAHVQPESVRESLTNLVSSQETFARGLATYAKSASDFLLKTAQESVKTDWSKLFSFNK